MVTCPECGSENLDLVERLVGDGRLIRCASCSNEWTRGGRFKPAAPRRPEPDISDVVLFENDDEGYLRWTSKHVGFVINTTRPPSPNYLMLHTTDCFHITASDHRMSDTSWTGNDYMKVCSGRKANLIAWAAEDFGSDPSRCQSCDP